MQIAFSVLRKLLQIRKQGRNALKLFNYETIMMSMKKCTSLHLPGRLDSVWQQRVKRICALGRRSWVHLYWNPKLGGVKLWLSCASMDLRGWHNNVVSSQCAPQSQLLLRHLLEENSHFSPHFYSERMTWEIDLSCKLA